jgi:hypothetical protein
MLNQTIEDTRPRPRVSRPQQQDQSIQGQHGQAPRMQMAQQLLAPPRQVHQQPPQAEWPDLPGPSRSQPIWSNNDCAQWVMSVPQPQQQHMAPQGPPEGYQGDILGLALDFAETGESDWAEEMEHHHQAQQAAQNAASSSERSSMASQPAQQGPQGQQEVDHQQPGPSQRASTSHPGYSTQMPPPGMVAYKKSKDVAEQQKKARVAHKRQAPAQPTASSEQ